MPKSQQQCKQIREETRAKILHDAMLYFAKNGFAGTKINDLAKHIGIAPGTLYLYFESKEDLFRQVFAMADISSEVGELRLLAHLPLSARRKVRTLSDHVVTRLTDETRAAKVALATQVMLEQNGFASAQTTYHSELYKITARIVEQGQREGSIVAGSALKLADYYWGVVYLYALKQLFTTDYETIDATDLARVLLRDE